MVLSIIKHYTETGRRFIVTEENKAEFTKQRVESEISLLKDWVLAKSVGVISCQETGIPLIFLSGKAFGMLSLDSLYPISTMDGDAPGQEWGPVSHVYQRLKNDKSPSQMQELHRNIRSLIPPTGFVQTTWNEFITRDHKSKTHHLSPTLIHQYERKWENQHPDARLKYKRIYNPNAKPDGIQRIHKKPDALLYLAAWQGRCSIFNIPLERIKYLFGSWCQDRVPDSANYENDNTIFVPEWVNDMTTGGIFKDDASIQAAMDTRGFKGDVRGFKIMIVQEFLASMVRHRMAKGL